MEPRRLSPALAVVAAVMVGMPITQSQRVVLSSKDQSGQVETAKAASKILNQFGVRLLTGLAGHEPQKNLFISPLSIFTALIMTENGAAGSTRDVMRQAMAVPAELSEDDLHQSASAVLKSLQSEKGVELAIANALWSDTRMPVADAFIQRCRDLYDAEAATLNFKQPSAANTINSWVSHNTRGKIQSIVDPATLRDSAALLTNAVYFKGTWQHQFPKAETQQGPFHLADGNTKNVPLMHLSSVENAYRGGDGFEAAALPYVGSSSIMFYAILPAAGKSPEQILENVQVEQLRSPPASTELDLRLPKFTLDFSAHLKGTLEHMGMSPAFHRGADFSSMSSKEFFIGDVIHKTRLEVDEEGTVATAVTGTRMHIAAVIRREHKVLVFDRPFAVLLCDNNTGAILFAGVVYEP